MVAPEFGKIVKEKKIVTGEILHVDAFGNVETKIARAMVKLKSENRQLSLETTDFLKIL